MAQQEQQQEQQQQQQRWLPLEANPEVLSSYLLALGGPRLPAAAGGGASSPPALGDPLLEFEDLVSLEPWAFDMLRCTDTVALLLVFPLLQQEGDAAERSHLPLPTQQQQHDPLLQQSLWFAKQTVPNACGTMALLHCAANLPRDEFPLPEDGFLATFLKETAGMDPAARGSLLEASSSLASLHVAYQHRGATAAAAAADTDKHFTCLLPWQGFVVELDGRKEKPVLRARIQSEQTFAIAAAEVIRQQFVEPRGESMQFAVLAVGDARTARD
ncbi:hypothetical protein Efla_000404 [Eimeria flavescens]